MTKALRALIVGLMLATLLVACGGEAEPAADVDVEVSPAVVASPAVAEESPMVMESMAASEEPMESMAASEEPMESMAPETTGVAAETGDVDPVELPEVIPSEVQGDIVTAGSSTVFPLSTAIAERWAEEGGPAPTIDSVGSGGGFERFCVAAETDIANASRPINDEERQACIDNGREAIEFRVGTDALAVVVNSENDFLENVTLEELQQIFSDEGGARLWSDINPDYPAEPIQRFIPGTDSGTFDYFVEEVFGDEDGAEEPILSAGNTQQSEDDNVLVTGIEGSPYAIGFLGYAYYQENQDQLTVVNVEGVEPNEETAESNEYPLSRPLFIYSADSIIDEKPQVGSFINYYLTNVNDVIDEVGYFQASTEALNESRQELLDAVGETAQ